jgi:hypothetical protein
MGRSRAGVVGGSLASEHEHTGADDAADAQADERERAERLWQTAFGAGLGYPN